MSAPWVSILLGSVAFSSTLCWVIAVRSAAHQAGRAARYRFLAERAITAIEQDGMFARDGLRLVRAPLAECAVVLRELLDDEQKGAA